MVAPAAFAAYLLGSLNLFAYLATVAPPAIVAGNLLAIAGVFTLAVMAARLTYFRLPGWAAALGFPAAWTTYEFLLSVASPHGTALNVAYSQTDLLPLLQIASVTGVFGITFLVTLVPSALAVAWTRRDGRVLIAPVVLLAACCGFGAARLAVRAESVVRVGLAATDHGIGSAFATEDPAKAVAVAREYAVRVERLAAMGAQVVVLPEKFVGVTAADAAAVEGVLRSAARAAGVTLIAGLNRVAPRPPHNAALVIAPDGEVAAEYEKHHMLPGPETGYVIGTVPGLFRGPGAQWGVAICKDMDFPSWSRRYGQAGVRILAVPAWDFVRDARLHSRMAVVRAVEEGFTMARAAQQGLLTLSDAYGRILGEASSGTEPEALLVQDIPAGPGGTFYGRHGDWFGWACVAGLVAILVASLRRRVNLKKRTDVAA